MPTESTGTLITSGISAVGTGGILSKLYDEVRSLYGPSLGIMNEYVNCMETNHRKMKGTAQMLFGTRNDVLDKINKDKENKPTRQCQAWIDKVNELEKAVKLLESEFSTAKKKSFKEGFEFSKVLEKINDELKGCLDQGSKIQVLVERTQPIVEVRPPEIKDKSSLYIVFTKMTDYFEDKEVKRIGLWRTVGVGKTAIMKNLNNSEQAKAFDIVIFATLPDEISQEMLKDGMDKEKLRELKLKALELAKEKFEKGNRRTSEVENRRYDKK